MKYRAVHQAAQALEQKALLLATSTPATTFARVQYGCWSFAAGQRIGPHEGPQQQALLMDGNPLLPPLVPPSGLSPPPDLGCAKGAALWGMLDSYAEGVTPGGFQVNSVLCLRIVFSSSCGLEAGPKGCRNQ